MAKRVLRRTLQSVCVQDSRDGLDSLKKTTHVSKKVRGLWGMTWCVGKICRKSRVNDKLRIKLTVGPSRATRPGTVRVR